MVKERFGPLLGLWAVYFVITMALFVALAIGVGVAGMSRIATMTEGDAFAVGAGMVLVGVLFYLGYLLVAMAQYASLMLMASPLSRPAFGQALSDGFRAAPALLLLLLVLLVAYFVAALVVGIIDGVLSVAGEWGTALLLLILVPALVWLGCRLSLLLAVVAVDKVRNPFTAIVRSWHLTRGHALAIFLASLIVVVILMVVSAIVLLPSFGLLSSISGSSDLQNVGSAIGGFALLGIGGLVVSLLFNAGYCAFMAVLHGTLTTAAGEGAAEAFA